MVPGRQPPSPTNNWYSLANRIHPNAQIRKSVRQVILASIMCARINSNCSDWRLRTLIVANPYKDNDQTRRARMLRRARFNHHRRLATRACHRHQCIRFHRASSTRFLSATSKLKNALIRTRFITGSLKCDVSPATMSVQPHSAKQYGTPANIELEPAAADARSHSWGARLRLLRPWGQASQGEALGTDYVLARQKYVELAIPERFTQRRQFRCRAAALPRRNCPHAIGEHAAHASFRNLPAQ